MTNIEISGAPREKLHSLPFWTDLDRGTQARLSDVTEQLITASKGIATLRMEQGKHFVEIETLLGRRRGRNGRYDKYLQTFAFNKRTAYRYKKMYLAVTKQLPPPALAVILEANYPLGRTGNPDRPLGPLTEPISAIPPPKTGSRENYSEWFTKILEAEPKYRKKQAVAALRPQDAEKKAFTWARRSYRRLPEDSKLRVKWAKSLIGKLLAEFGLPGQRFEPEAVPEDYRRSEGWQKGRSRKN